MFARRPLYSACNEDTASEIKALQPGSGDTIIAVSAGGGRALSLLTTGPARLIAIDRRTDQVCNLELKAAAIEMLEYPDFADFIGLRDGYARLDIYRELRPVISRSARAYWDRRSDLIEGGVLYAGRTERALSRYAMWLRRLGIFGWLERCFEAGSLEEQMAVLEAAAADVKRVEGFWALFISPAAFFSVTRDPSFLRSTHGSIGRYLYRRFLASLARNLISDSFFAHLIYYGAYSPMGSLPLYLDVHGYDLVKKGIPNLEISCYRLEEVVARRSIRGRTKWSLSDVSAWMSERHFQGLVRAIVESCQPGSRVCARNFAADRRIPSGLVPGLQRLDALSAELADSDTSMFYTFEVAEFAPEPPPG